MNRGIAFVDVDATVADLGPAWIGRYNRDYDDNLDNNSITGWHTHKFVKPECGTKIYEYLLDPSLYDEVPPIPGALDGVNYLRQVGFRVVFATSSPWRSAGRKCKWLIDHGFLQETMWPKDYIEISDKGLLIGGNNILIDDGFHNIQAFTGIGILYRRPHNALEEWQNILYGWNDIYRMF